MQNNHILIAASLSGNISSEEKRALNDWLQESDEHRAEFQSCKKMWELWGKQREKSEYNAVEAWEDFEKLKQQTRKPQVLRINFVRAAAAVILVATMAYVINQIFFDKVNPIQQAKVAAAYTEFNDQEREVVMISLYTEDSVALFTLPDSSRVYLNRSSVLQYPENFSSEGRVTYLKGEAFFEVKPNNALPFVVNYDSIQVKVLGTSFGIRENERQGIEISVSSGTVAVANEKMPAHKMILHQNEKCTFSKEAPFISKEYINGKENTWKEKKRVGRIKRLIQKLKKRIQN